jgi:hypothetical protein
VFDNKEEKKFDKSLISMNVQVEITKIFHTTGTTIYTSDCQKKKGKQKKIIQLFLGGICGSVMPYTSINC